MSDNSQFSKKDLTQAERKLRRRLNLPLSMELGKAPGFYTGLLYTGFFFIVAFVAWASLAEIRELTVADGELKPVGSVRLVQHLEGGIVSEILVAEGQHIDKGDVLLRLQPTDAVSDLQQIRSRQGNLELQAERLAALLEDRKPNFDPSVKVSQSIINSQRDIFFAERERFRNEHATLRARIEQRQTELDNATRLLVSQENQSRVAEEEFALQGKLKQKKLIAESTYLNFRREYETSRGALLAAEGNIEISKDALIEARKTLTETESAQREEWASEHNRILAEVEELNAGYTKAKARVGRLTVRAPSAGIVQELAPRAIGEIMQPGQVIGQIVPVDQDLIAEVRVDPSDIGHVNVGMGAEVKLSSFDAARYGTISAVVDKISPTTFFTETGEPYYRASLKLGRNDIGLNGERHQIIPGMVVNAEIITGNKSIVRYMMKPVFRAFDLALSER